MTEWLALRDWIERGGVCGKLARGLIEADVESRSPAAALRVPGRIELFGKHTDYAGGRSLVTAIDRGLDLLVTPRPDSEVRWRDFGRGVETRFDVVDPGTRPGHWSNYLRTPARRVGADFGPFARGVDVAMASDLPAAAGLSSSSALVVAAYLAFDAADPGARGLGLEDRQRLAGFLGAVESGGRFEDFEGGEGVGVFGGSEDHAAILCSKAGEVAQFRFCPLALERRITLPPKWRLAVGVSGVHAKKADGVRRRFNLLSSQAAEAAAAFKLESGSEAPDLGAALAAAGSAGALERVVEERLSGADGEGARRRLRHFLMESERLVPAAAAALAGGEENALGALALESQQGAELLLGNQVPETVALARLATATGAVAASAFGGGFGGAVWALAPAGGIEDFLDAWRQAYTESFPQHRAASRFFATRPVGGASWSAIDGDDDPTEELP